MLWATLSLWNFASFGLRKVRTLGSLHYSDQRSWFAQSQGVLELRTYSAKIRKCQTSWDRLVSLSHLTSLPCPATSRHSSLLLRVWKWSSSLLSLDNTFSGVFNLAHGVFNSSFEFTCRNTSDSMVPHRVTALCDIFTHAVLPMPFSVVLLTFPGLTYVWSP